MTQDQPDSQLAAQFPDAVQPANPAEMELKEFATHVRDTLNTWAGRLVQAIQSGRSPTSGARMATARSLAEFKKLALPMLATDQEDIQELQALVVGYLKQASATVSRAAHEIERNRYSLEAMERQLTKLDELYQRINPTVEAPQPEAAGEGSVQEKPSEGVAALSSDLPASVLRPAPSSDN